MFHFFYSPPKKKIWNNFFMTDPLLFHIQPNKIHPFWAQDTFTPRLRGRDLQRLEDFAAQGRGVYGGGTTSGRGRGVLAEHQVAHVQNGLFPEVFWNGLV